MNGIEKLTRAERDDFYAAIRRLRDGDTERAITALERLHETYPQATEIALNLGGAYILEQEYDRAAELLERASEQRPQDANLWVNLAAARLGPLETSGREEQEGAIAAYQRALEADPESPNVHYMLGLIYRARRDDLRAAAHFTRALEQNPEDRHARRALATIAAERTGGDDDE